MHPDNCWMFWRSYCVLHSYQYRKPDAGSLAMKIFSTLIVLLFLMASMPALGQTTAEQVQLGNVQTGTSCTSNHQISPCFVPYGTSNPMPTTGGGSSSGLSIGTTTISGGTNTFIEYNNNGVLGEYGVTGTGTTAVLSTSPTFTTGITTPLVIGGAGGASTLTLEGNSTGIPVVVSTTGLSVNTVPVYGLPNWQKAFQNVARNNGNAIICTVGDSTTWGYLSTGTVSTSWPTQFSNVATSDYGLRSNWNSFMGDGGNTGVSNAYYSNGDSRITFGSGWSADTAKVSLGYNTFKASSTTSNFSFLPTTSVDTFVIFYVIDASQGILAANIDGGANTTQSTSGSAGVGTLTMTAGSVGSHTLNLNWSSGGQVNVIGAYAYNSTISQINVVNAGSGAETSTQAATQTNAYSPGNSGIYSAIGCNLTAIKLGINDVDSGVSAATYKANIQTIITAAKTAGSDVILVSPIPSNPSNNVGNISNAAQATYYYNLNALAQTNNVPIVDDFQSWESYAFALPLNLYADTFVHPNQSGHFENARSFAQAALGRPTQSKNEFTQTAALGGLSLGGATLPGIIVNPNQHVGIGTASPDNTMTINMGGATSGNALHFYNTDANSGGNIQTTFGDFAMESNVLYNGSGYVAEKTGASSLFLLNGASTSFAGSWSVWTAPSVSAGSAPSFTERMYIANTGAVVINNGTTQLNSAQLSVHGIIDTDNNLISTGSLGIGSTSPLTTVDVLTSTASATVGVLNIVDTGDDGGFNDAFNVMYPNLGTTHSVFWGWGRAPTTNNSATLSFNSIGAGLGGNTASLGLFGQPFGLNVSSGSVGIGTQTALSTLDVNGNTAIGSGYVVTAPPTNGLIVQGNVGLGTSAIVSGSGTTINGHIGYAPTNIPTVTTCGSGTLVAGSTDNKGQITGITAATACTITFSSVLPAAPACSFSTSTGIAAGGIPSTSGVTSAMALFTGTLGYMCQ